MAFCTHCGKEILSEAVICPHCGCAVPKETAVDDTVSTGLVILSVLLPLFGIIYWAVCEKETPKRAKACGKAALWSWGISICLSVIIWIITLISLNIGLSML